MSVSQYRVPEVQLTALYSGCSIPRPGGPEATLLIDLRDAIRGLRASRGTTALAFFILSLAIAAGTVTFSVVDTIALRSLPYASPHRLVAIGRVSSRDGSPALATAPDYFIWRDGVRSFDAVGASTGGGTGLLRDNPEPLYFSRVSANLFDVLGVRPALGRLFGPQDERPGNDVVVLSHDVWMSRFGGDPAIVGRSISFTVGSRQVIGVLPPGVAFPITTARPPDLYVPYVATADDRSLTIPRTSSGTPMWVVGRLRGGVSLAQARADVERVSAATVAAYPLSRNTVFKDEPSVMALHDRLIGPAKGWLLMVLAAVGLVLAVACVNVANLLLARATIRLRELATRQALGASRTRLTRTMLLEGLMLSLASAATGIAASFWGVSTAKAALPAGLVRASGISIDARVLVLSVAVAVLTGLLFSIAPAWLGWRCDVVSLLKAGGGAVIGGRRRGRALSGLLVAQVAVVCTLLVATSLVVASFVLVTTVDLGFERRDVFRAYLPVKSLEDVPETNRAAARLAAYTEILNRVRSVPGVTGAAMSSNAGPPLGGGRVRYSINIPGLGETSYENMLETRIVSADYFATLGMRLVRGRTFNAADVAGAPGVCVISDTAQSRFFGARDPIGETIGFNGRSVRIVGILQPVRFGGPEEDLGPEIYLPVDQDDPGRNTRVSGVLVVRSPRDAATLEPAIRNAIGVVLGDGSSVRFDTLNESFRRITAARRFNAGLMSLFGFLAIAIGAIGIYSTMAFLVSQQVPAIGLRMALGATPGRVLRSVLGVALWRIGVGSALGLAAAWAMSSVFSSLVFGVTTTSPAVYAGVVGLLAIVGLVAALVPARRAAQVDPMVALRRE